MRRVDVWGSVIRIEDTSSSVLSPVTDTGLPEGVALSIDPFESMTYSSDNITEICHVLTHFARVCS